MRIVEGERMPLLFQFIEWIIEKTSNWRKRRKKK